MSTPELLDEQALAKILGTPPFVTIEGVINARDVLASKQSSSYPGRTAKPGYLFRSGEPTHVTEKGQEQIRKLGIKKIFDFRADKEIKSFGVQPLQIEGVELVRVPVAGDDTFNADNIAKALEAFRVDEQRTFMQVYSAFLKSGGPSYEVILKHVRDHPQEPVLVHCTSGKDRTGVLAAVILMLLGVPDDLIVQDYALTSAGLQPAIAILTERFQKIEIYKNNWEGVLNMGTSKPETMRSFLMVIREKFGGAEQYIKDHTSLTDDDIKIIRENLLTA